MSAPIGNQFAKKAKIWEQAIKRALARRANGEIDHGLDELADKLLNACANGDLPALKELGDRLDGRPTQTLAGDPEAPLGNWTITSVDPKPRPAEET
jgi:hypothetical protein